MGIKGDRDETEVSVDKDGYEQELKRAKAKANIDVRRLFGLQLREK